MQNLLTLKALYIKGFMVFDMAFRARKVSGTFEKRAPAGPFERTQKFAYYVEDLPVDSGGPINEHTTEVHGHSSDWIKTLLQISLCY